MVDRHYPRAPISEAIIDLQVEFTSPPPQSAFVDAAQKIRDRFPVSQPIQMFEMNFGGATEEAQPTVKSERTETGMRLTNNPPTRVLQLQRRGFTFSHLPPYSDWGTFSDEAKELWNQFVPEFGPTRVVRAATRYINRIVVPADKADFREYFTLYPNVPAAMPQTVTGCFMQLVIPQPNGPKDTSAVINFALEPSANSGGLSFLLDFDVFSPCHFDPTADEVWNVLAQLRTVKNELFEASITDATRELFK
ncbi:TIGR04255 family protein [Paraburkholderia sp. 32]|uniref:TIGR04255 family protein n=1 Tax=Paraburkholderia sp. 32 TaxID=2991057 RepID=UPI003D1AB4D2